MHLGSIDTDIDLDEDLDMNTGHDICQKKNENMDAARTWGKNISIFTYY